MTNKIVLHYRDGCPFCDKALAWVKQYAPTAELNKIVGVPAKMEFYKEHKVSTLPQFYINDVLVGGWSDFLRNPLKAEIEG